MENKKKGILYLLIAVLLYSIMPVLIRFLGKGNIPPMSQVFLRYCVAFLCSIIYIMSTRSTLYVSKKDYALLFFVALFGYALVNLFYTYANLNTQIGTVLFIFNCSTVIGPFLGYVFLKERLTKSTIFAMIIGFISLFFLFSPGSMATWKMGAIYALLAAIGSSVYMIGRKKLGAYDSIILLFANTLVGVVTLGILALLFESSFYFGRGIFNVAPVTWLVTILFGIDNFAAYLFMTKGFQIVSAGTGSMVLLLENFTGLLFAYIFFQEIPAYSSLFGGAIILFASYLVIRSQLFLKNR